MTEDSDIEQDFDKAFRPIAFDRPAGRSVVPFESKQLRATLRIAHALEYIAAQLGRIGDTLGRSEVDAELNVKNPTGQNDNR